jgi:hypothetical protein
MKSVVKDPVVGLGLLGIVMSVVVSFIELDQVMGLPAHALLAHAPVVLLPLAALGTFAVMFRESWRKQFGFLLMAITLAAVVLTVMTAGAGEQLHERIDGDHVDKHADAGEILRIIAFIFGISMVAFVTIERHVRLLAVRVIGRAAVVAVAALTLGWTAYTGHLGSEAVWSEQGGTSEEQQEQQEEAAEDAAERAEEQAEEAADNAEDAARDERGGKGRR